MPYVSQGTISVEFDAANNKKYFFVPEHDYSIKHEECTYAVFVSLDDPASNARLMPLSPIQDRADETAIEIQLDPFNLGPTDNGFSEKLLFHARVNSAVMMHSRVLVKVGDDDKMTDVIPARSRRLRRRDG